MMEQNWLGDPVKSPEIQEIILSNRIGSIAAELAKRLEIAPIRALQLFYESKTCADLHDKETGLYLYGNLYIADEFMREYQNKFLFSRMQDKCSSSDSHNSAILNAYTIFIP